MCNCNGKCSGDCKCGHHNEDNRTDWDEYFMAIARVVSSRSTCRRRHYGAIIVHNNNIISTGYNGAPSGEAHCIETGCEREKLNIPHGQQYEKCVAVHAEQNALIRAPFGDYLEESCLYIYGYDCAEKKEIQANPCEICRPMIKNSGIKYIVNRMPNGELTIKPV